MLMAKIHLKIDYHTSIFSRYFPRIRKGVNYGIIFCLTVSIVYFTSTNIMSSLEKTFFLMENIESLEKEVALNTTKLNELNQLTQDNKNWLPVNSIPGFQVCENDTIAFQRLIRLGLEKQIELFDLTIQKQDKVPVGFDYGFTLAGSYSDIVEFLKSIEMEFVIFEIKRVHLMPIFAEDKYKGELHLNLEGWLL